MSYLLMWTNGLVYAWEGEGNGNPLQYSILGNPMDKVAWQATVHSIATVHRVAKSEHDQSD